MITALTGLATLVISGLGAFFAFKYINECVETYESALIGWILAAIWLAAGLRLSFILLLG